MQAKYKGKVKPAYYGEAMAQNEMLDRIEEAESEEREWKARKGGQKRAQSAVEDTTGQEPPLVAEDTTHTEIPPAADVTDHDDEDEEICPGCGGEEGIQKQKA